MRLEIICASERTVIILICLEKLITWCGVWSTWRYRYFV